MVNHPNRSTRMKWVNGLKERMGKAFDARDPQMAADIICEARNSTEQDWAMHAASEAGFRPEFYVNSVRVHLPGK